MIPKQYYVHISLSNTASSDFNCEKTAKLYFDATKLGWKDYEGEKPLVELKESKDGGKTWEVLSHWDGTPEKESHE